jgi:hypothetical protein
VRSLVVAGIVVLILGILSFIVPVPNSETHGAKIGDTTIGVTTHSNKTLPPAIGGIMVAAGVVMLIAGTRKTA